MPFRLFLVLVCLAGPALAQDSWTIDTFAGTLPGPDGDALDAFLGNPVDLDIDDQGNLYIADLEMHWIRQVTPDGQITNFAGTGVAATSGDGGPASQAQLGRPRGVAVGSQGDVYFHDGGAVRIRRVDAAGNVTTFAGNGGFDQNRVPAGEPAIEYPLGGITILDYDRVHDVLYIYQNRRVVIVENGTVQHLAGDGQGGFAGDGGPPTEAQFSFFVSDMRVGPDGCLYLADSNNRRIRKISADRSTITTVVGNGESDFTTIADGTLATETGLPSINGLAFDSNGRLHFGGSGRIYRLEADGTLTLVANLRTLTGALPGINRMRFDSSDNIYVLDSGNRSVRRIPNTLDQVELVAGGLNVRGNDGPALQARFHRPSDLAFTPSGDLIVGEVSNRAIRSISPGGQITHVAGSGNSSTTFTDNEQQAATANLGGIRYVTSSPEGNVIFAQGRRIKEIQPDGVLRTLATAPGNAVAADVEFGPDGLVYFSNTRDRMIMRIEADGETVTTIAGNGGRTFEGEGGPATEASFSSIDDFDFDDAGNIYIAETRARRILKVDADSGILTTIAGTGACCNSGDGGLASEAMVAPARLTVGPGDFPALYFSTISQTVRRIFTPAAAALAAEGPGQGIGPGALIDTIAGNLRGGFSGDGGPATQAMLNNPLGLALGPDGRIYVADAANNRIRVLAPNTGPVAEDNSVTSAASFFPGGAPDSISSLFGRSLALETVVNDQPVLPTTLGDVTIEIIDSAGATHTAQLFFVSSRQINFLFPADAAVGPATLRLTRGAESLEVSFQVERINPALFSINATGSGVGAIIALRVAADGTRSGVQVFEFDGTRFVGTPIDLSPEGDQVFLSLFGTGIRGMNDEDPLRALVATDSVSRLVPVLGFAPSAEFLGLDQVNIGPLPRDLIGSGELRIQLIVGDERSNLVTVTIQ